MNHASLFSGIGGFDLAAEWMGWNNVFNCEIEEFPRKVLKYHFPNAIQYHEIKQTDFTIHRGEIDILSGGFPCQPFSVAGKRLGKNDERHLWPEMYRAIQEIKPKWIVGENVRGLLNWSDGLVLDEVYIDLENEGYEIETFVLPAASVNAPHKRDRVWIIASNTEDSRHRGWIGEGCSSKERAVLQNEQRGDQVGCEIERCSREWIDKQENITTNAINCGHSSKREKIKKENRVSCINREEMESRKFDGTDIPPNTSNTNGDRSQEHNISAEPGKKVLNSWRDNEAEKDWSDFPTQSPIRSRDDGFPFGMDGITVSKWRTESIKAYGNAIVPQVAYRLFRTIQYVENQNK